MNNIRITFKKIFSCFFREENSEGKKSFMNLSLNFKDQKIEEKYRKDINRSQFAYLKIYQAILPLSLLLFWLFNPFDSDRFETHSLIFQSINGVSNILLFIYFINKMDFRYPDFALVFLQIYTIVGYIEFLVDDEGEYSGPVFMGIIIFLEIITLIPKNSRCRWNLVVVSNLVTNIYLIMRFNNYSNDYKISFLSFPSFAILMNFLAITLWSYFSEKFERRLFYHRFKDEEGLKRFEEIIRRLIPSSVIIFSKGNAIFSNDEANKFLNIERDSAGKKLSEIILTAHKQSNEFCELNIRSELELIVHEDALQTNLLTYISSLDKIQSNRTQFSSLMGTIQDNKSNINEFNKISDSVKYLEIKLARIPWMGEEALILILTEDLSRKKLIDLEKQAVYKDELLATVSHDLRTPLNGIIGILDIALESLLDKDLRKMLQVALRSSYLLLFMINDLLDLSQISKGTFSLNPVNFNIEELTRDVVKLIKYQAKQKGISVEIYNSCVHYHSFFSDPNRIKQVLLNLLSNALKFTQVGAIKIYIEQVGLKSEGVIVMDKKEITGTGYKALKFSVEDSGSGIRPEDIHKLFKFFGMIRNEETKKVNKSGVGLGLAISQKLVRVLNNFREGGEITVKSEIGKGSVFSFIIEPFEEKKNENYQTKNSLIKDNSLLLHENDSVFSENNHNYKGPHNFPIPQGNFNASNVMSTNKKILIVDDDQINIMVLSKFLKTFKDCEFQVAFNGKEAIDTVLKNAQNGIFFKIIFMDCSMPILDGFEATKILLQMVSFKQIPSLNIIASTANTSQADHQNCYNCGMVDIISKPFTKKIIREKVDLYS